MGSSLHSSARASLSFPPAGPPRDVSASQPDLAALAERIGRSAPGFLIVSGDADTAAALREYVVRQARVSHATALSAMSRPGAPLWHDVGMQLSPLDFGGGAQDAAATVDHLIQATRGRRVVVVAPLPSPPSLWDGSWDRAVSLELAGRAHPFLVVFVRGSEGSRIADSEALHAEHFEVPVCLTAREKSVWWSVLAESAALDMPDADLASLETWWMGARRATSAPAVPRDLTEEEQDLLTKLRLAGRPWRRLDLGLLAARPDPIPYLIQDGFLRETDDWLTVDSDSLVAPAPAPTSSVLMVVARALATLAKNPADPWAFARAADLYLRAGDVAAADSAMEHALSHLEDSVARAEMSSRWATAVAGCPAAERLLLQQRGAARALAVGEAEEAHRWARAAAALAPNDVDVTLLLGRSLVALGDLVAAEVTLKRGASLAASTPALAAQVSAELAEIAYLKGDMAGASAHARAALATTDGQAGHEAAAKARNTLGKILLAEARWEDADLHFAEDALLAASRGDTTAELRARLNRGIAFLSKGALDEARTMFEEVEREGERLGDFRASAFALDNLAVVAIWRHEYAAALTLSERTLKLRRRLGDRLTTARIVGNLAELRRKLGLLDHADHAVAFGRRALGPGMPPERGAHFSFVAARIALDRGRTDAAQREVSRAIHDAELAGHRKLLAEAHRVATRIALEDGDLGRARTSLASAKDLIATDEARAEVALLEALLARASGEDAEALGQNALALARIVGEEEGLLDAHILLSETYRSRDEIDTARAHLVQAMALRDQVTLGLPPDVAAAFLSRRDVASLERLHEQLASTPTSSIPPPGSSGSELVSSRPASRGSQPPQVELVGADPSMRGLQATIKKVARSNSTVLIRGESGTGKELVAAALHRASERAMGPMVTVNCAALVETLLLSELFGHEKGAFTGATARRRGRFELAEGGTLFLDEIGDISAKTQVALLRVLQERTFERVGGAAPIHVDVRVVCATHRDLKSMVERGEFREDLYYRLRGITLDVPALRTRLSDLPALSDHLLGRIALERGEPKKVLAPSALDLLATHHWPGNVRELENALRAASLFAETSTITLANLTENVDDLRRTADSRDGFRAVTPTPPPSPSVLVAPPSVQLEDDSEEGGEADGERPLPVDEANATAVAYAQVRQGALSLSDLKRQIERDCIARALAETKGNITRAATLLGMKRPRLSQLVKHYGLAAVSSEAS